MGEGGDGARYWELSSVHGKLEPLAEIELSPKLAVEVILRFGDKREFRRVPLQQSVGQFKVAAPPCSPLLSSN